MKPGLFRSALVVALVLPPPIFGSATPAAPAQGLDPVSVQLKWHHQTQFAGLYVADAKGFYRAEGLSVQHHAWKIGSPSPINQVVSGAAHFGITSHTEFLIAREKGARVVAIAAIYQKSPVGFFALKSSSVKHPRDFAGRSIAYAPTHEVHLKAMLQRMGVDLAALRRLPYGFDLTPFYRGDVAIWGGYIMNQPVDARLAGYEVTIVFPGDYGVYTYDDIVFTSEDLIARHPGVIERWLRAALRGWRYAIEHPDEATRITVNVDATLNPDKQLAMLLASIPLIHTGQAPIGWMSRDVWHETHRILLEQKILAHPLRVEAAYTTHFLEKVPAR
jgi:NitT/TauT family transport system substrate-binding protein